MTSGRIKVHWMDETYLLGGGERGSGRPEGWGPGWGTQTEERSATWKYSQNTWICYLFPPVVSPFALRRGEMSARFQSGGEEGVKRRTVDEFQKML